MATARPNLTVRDIISSLIWYKQGFEGCPLVTLNVDQKIGD